VNDVLMIAYHYPPEGSSSGVLRTLKFSKYLPTFGWRAHVLTLKEECYLRKDEELARDIPSNAVVHRTAALDPRLCFSLPDRFAGWVPIGVLHGKRLSRRERIDAIFSTSPFPSAHLIALLLKRSLKRPWVADFRDPWVEDGAWPRPGSLRYRIESFLEKRVLWAADWITVTTDGLKEHLLRRCPEISAEKIVVIENGFDEEDFRDVEKKYEPEACRLIILHAGMVTPEYRDPFPLLEALANLVRAGKIARGAVTVRFLGGGRYPESAGFTARVEDLGLRDCVDVQTRVSYRQCLASLCQADALLLLQDSDDTRHLVPAKAYEYLRAARPILALTTQGATAELIRRSGRGYLVDPGNRSQIEATLLTLMASKANGGRVSDLPDIDLRRYERRELTARLAGLLAAAKT